MAMPAPVSFVYCLPDVAVFEIDYPRGQFPCGQHKLTIKDAQGTVVFDVKIQNYCGMHTHDRVVCEIDPAENVLVLVRKKMFTFRPRWSAFHGEDGNDSNLLFNLSKAAIFQRTPSFDIFLASNQTSCPDFVVTGNYRKYNYDILFNGSPVAKVRKKAQESLLEGNRAHVVTIFPGVDHAFIASVVAIMDKLKEDFDIALVAAAAAAFFIGNFVAAVLKGLSADNNSTVETPELV